MKPSEMFQQAVNHHQAGRFAEAEELYCSVLQVEPRHPDANHNLGLIAMQLNQAERGFPYLQTAWEAEPSIGQYWLALTECLLQMGNSEDALLLIDDAIRRGLDSPYAQQLLMRAKGCHDAKTKHADVVVGAAGEAMAVSWERRAQATEQSEAEHQHVFKESPPVLPVALQTGKKPIKAKREKFARKPVPHQEKSPSPQEINTLVALFSQGRYTEAIVLAQKMTVRFPAHKFGWKALGAVFKQMGRHADALAPMQKALALSPNDAEAHSNLGITLQELNRLDEAEASFRRALQLKPDYAEAHSDMGITLQKLGRLGEAEASFRRALQLKPDYVVAHNNLGNTLLALGLLDEAEASYRRALEFRPDFAEALCNLGHTLCDLDELGQAAAIYQKALDTDPANRGLDAAVYLAVLYYLDGNLEQCRSKLHASQPIMAKTESRYKNVRSYWFYLDRLLSWHGQSSQKGSQTQSMGTLYVIGESHSLAAHGAVVRYNGQEMRCVAEWISGCKQWHLGNTKANKYKHKFEAVMARLPRESVILLSIGEIDCRHDEGIIKAWEKCPDKALAEIVQSTVDAYLGYVAAIGARYGHRIIVGGVPATNISLDSLDQSAAGQLIHLIRIFNAALKSQALAAGMDFLDVYTLTDGGEGIASGKWHIDGIHLLPCAVVEAFDRYCTLHQ